VIHARAAVLQDVGGDPQLADVTIRPPVDDEVLVRIDAVGICHTDVSVAARWAAKRLPMVFGHEGAGTVVSAGPRAAAGEGQQVVLTFASCGQCGSCTDGRPAYCDRSTDLNLRGDRRDDDSALRLDGRPVTGGFFGQSSFATHALARPANTVVLNEPLAPELAAPLGCSVQTGVGTVLNALSARRDDALVVFGAGAVGLSVVMGARIAGCHAIVAVDPVADRRALAEELGATATIDPTAGDTTAAIGDVTGGGPTLAVDTTALPAVIATAITVLRSCGTLALVGLGAPNSDLPVGLIMGKGLRVRGVVEGDSNAHTFIPQLAELCRSGELPLDKIVTTFDLESFDQAWDAAKTGRVVKPVLVAGR
jgi:aryl-alcohol dehydrogenase